MGATLSFLRPVRDVSTFLHPCLCHNLRSLEKNTTFRAHTTTRIALRTKSESPAAPACWQPPFASPPCPFPLPPFGVSHPHPLSGIMSGGCHHWFAPPHSRFVNPLHHTSATVPAFHHQRPRREGQETRRPGSSSRRGIVVSLISAAVSVSVFTPQILVSSCYLQSFAPHRIQLRSPSCTSTHTATWEPSISSPSQPPSVLSSNAPVRCTSSDARRQSLDVRFSTGSPSPTGS